MKSIDMKFETIDDLRNSRSIILDFWNRYIDIGDVLTSQEMFMFPLLSRMMEINESFNKLTDSENFNYLGAAPLVRLQIDTLLYCYAGTIVDDFIEFLECFMNGDKWTRLKTKDGNSLSESYLIDRLCELYDNEVIKVYYRGFSDYIHLSINHLFATLNITEAGYITQSIGDFSMPDNERDLLDIMLLVNIYISHMITASYVPFRKLEMERLEELRKRHPYKSDIEIFNEFGYGSKKLKDLFLGQLRLKNDYR